MQHSLMAEESALIKIHIPKYRAVGELLVDKVPLPVTYGGHEILILDFTKWKIFAKSEKISRYFANHAKL